MQRGQDRKQQTGQKIKTEVPADKHKTASGGDKSDKDRQVDRCQTCCCCFCFSAQLDRFGGTAVAGMGRGQQHHPAQPHASVNKMESLSWWTAPSWGCHLCQPTSALSPRTCEYYLSCTLTAFKPRLQAPHCTVTNNLVDFTHICLNFLNQSSVFRTTC